MSQPNSRSEPFNIGEIERILDSLANEDALKIFIAAKEGIRKSTKTIKELGLTQKRYYTRLKELIKAGLIEKRDNIYQLTTIGMVCYTLGEAFDKTLVHRDRLDLADRLRRAKSISLEETKQILQAISSKGIIGSLGIADIIQPVKMFNDYETGISEFINRIDRAEKGICLASYYTDTRVMEAVLRALQRGVKFALLTGGQENVVEKLRMVKMILMPKTAKAILDLINNKEVRLRHKEIPYSFCVIDEEIAIIELPNPLTKAFYVGFSLQSKELCQRLRKTFEDLYRLGEEDPIVSLLRRGVGSL